MLAGAFGCERARRVPRVEPVLHAWERPYRGLPGLELHVFETGRLSLPRGFLFQGGSWFERSDLPVPAYVIRHPDGRLIVFDTGFSAAVNADPNTYLGFFPSIVGGFSMADGQDLPSQMRGSGIDPSAVSHVVLSHLHFDHAGTVEGFPGAAVLLSSQEHANAERRSRDTSLFNRADFDGVSDWANISFDNNRPYATFSSHLDVLGDGSLVAVPLPGHTAGSIGLLVRLVDGPVLLAGDAAPLEESWRYAAMPFWAEDRDLWWDTIWRVKRFLQLVPEAELLGGHDQRAVAFGERHTIVPHIFESPS